MAAYNVLLSLVFSRQTLMVNFCVPGICNICLRSQCHLSPSYSLFVHSHFKYSAVQSDIFNIIFKYSICDIKILLIFLNAAIAGLFCSLSLSCIFYLMLQLPKNVWSERYDHEKLQLWEHMYLSQTYEELTVREEIARIWNSNVIEACETKLWKTFFQSH